MNGCRRIAELSALLVLCLLTGVAPAQAAGSWTRGPDFTAPRAYAAGVTLADGSVLVIGGVQQFQPYVLHGDAERLAPGASSWTSAGQMLHPREQHTATLLSDGSVLVAGGQGSHGPVAQAERYDPATNSWSAAGSLSFVRWAHTATRLPDGRVLVAGGINSIGHAGNFTARVEIYDPRTNSWFHGRPMLEARWAAMAVRLRDGRVLIAGGYQAGGAVTSAELYDPRTNRWSRAAPMHLGHADGTATRLRDGRVLVVGSTRRADVYDPARNRWTLTGRTTPRVEFSATRLRNGDVLAAGGFTTSAPTRTMHSAELYDPRRNTWVAVHAMPTSRADQVAALERDGRVVIAGGVMTRRVDVYAGTALRFMETS